MSILERVVYLLDGYGRRRRFQVFCAAAMFLNWFVFTVWRPEFGVGRGLYVLDSTLLLIWGALLGRHIREFLAIPLGAVVPRWNLPVAVSGLSMAAVAAAVVYGLAIRSGDANSVAFAASVGRVTAGLLVGFHVAPWAAGTALLVMVGGPTFGHLVATTGLNPAQWPITPTLLVATTVFAVIWIMRGVARPVRGSGRIRRARLSRVRWRGRWLPLPRDKGALVRQSRAPRSSWVETAGVAFASAVFLGAPTAASGRPMVGAAAALLVLPMLMLLRSGWTHAQLRRELLLPRRREHTLFLLAQSTLADFVESYLVVVAITTLPVLWLAPSSLEDYVRLNAIALGANLWGLGAATIQTRLRDWPYSATIQCGLPAVVAFVGWRLAADHQWLGSATFMGLWVVGGGVLGAGAAVLGFRLWVQSESKR